MMTKMPGFHVESGLSGAALLLAVLVASLLLAVARASAQDLQMDLPEESGPVRAQPPQGAPPQPAAKVPEEEKTGLVPAPEAPQEKPQIKHEERPEPKALTRMVNRLLNILTADNGTNRTAVVGRAQLSSEYRETRDSSKLFINVARADVPLANNLLWRTDADFRSFDPASGGGGRISGVGDLSTRLGSKIWEAPAFTAFIEGQIVFPTASDDLLGRGKFQLVPAVFFSIPVKPLDFIMFPGVQQSVSVGGDPSRKEVNLTKLNLEMTKPWANSLWWTTVEPVLYLDWTQNAKTACNLEFELGRRLGDHWRAWLRPAVGLWGTGVPGAYDWYTQVGIRYMF